MTTPSIVRPGPCWNYPAASCHIRHIGLWRETLVVPASERQTRLA
jgi:hypothetical protein